MDTIIESNATSWKEYNPKGRHYIIWQSCKYECTPGEPRPATEGNLPPRLTVRIFVHELMSGEEVRIGEIGIFVDRGRLNELGDFNNESEADTQLGKGAHSAAEGNWEIEPLTRILRKSCEVIPTQIKKYETDGSPMALCQN